MIKKHPLLSTLALVSLVLAGCNTAANTPTNSGSSGGSAGGGGDTVKVAAITSFTTSTAPLGIPGYNAEKNGN